MMKLPSKPRWITSLGKDVMASKEGTAGRRFYTFHLGRKVCARTGEQIWIYHIVSYCMITVDCRFDQMGCQALSVGFRGLKRIPAARADG